MQLLSNHEVSSLFPLQKWLQIPTLHRNLSCWTQSTASQKLKQSIGFCTVPDQCGSPKGGKHQEIASMETTRPKRLSTNKSSPPPCGFSGLSISHAKTLQKHQGLKPKSNHPPARQDVLGCQLKCWKPFILKAQPSQPSNQIPTHWETMRSEIIMLAPIWIDVSLQKESARSTFWHRHRVFFHHMPHPHCPNQLPQKSWPWSMTTFIIASYPLSYFEISVSLHRLNRIFRLDLPATYWCGYNSIACPRTRSSAVLEPMRRSLQSTCKEAGNNSKLP